MQDIFIDLVVGNLSVKFFYKSSQEHFPVGGQPKFLVVKI